MGLGNIFRLQKMCAVKRVDRIAYEEISRGGMNVVVGEIMDQCAQTWRRA